MTSLPPPGFLGGSARAEKVQLQGFWKDPRDLPSAVRCHPAGVFQCTVDGASQNFEVQTCLQESWAGSRLRPRVLREGASVCARDEVGGGSDGAPGGVWGL